MTEEELKKCREAFEGFARDEEMLPAALHDAAAKWQLDSAWITWQAAWKHVNSPIDELIIQWAKDRNLIEGATKQSQTVKLMEEMGELAEGVAKSKQDLVKDSLGDMYVVMTILAEMHGVTMKECIALAYDEIKNRKGKMIDGVFVKEE